MGGFGKGAQIGTSLAIAGLFAACLQGCGSVARHHAANSESIMAEAENIAIYEKERYDEVVITDTRGVAVARYALVARNDSAAMQEVRKGSDDAVILAVPVQNLALDSEVYAAALEELGAESLIGGMFDADYITLPSVSGKIETGEVENLGHSDNPDIERLVALQPDAMLISYYDGMRSAIGNTGIPVIKMYDLQEPTPLGRAEWMRFIGRLAGKGERADSIFKAVSEAYNRFRDNAGADGKKRPKVLTEIQYQGTWYVPGGQSYQARMIEDAGGDYFMNADSAAGSLNLSSEQVLTKGGDADVWLIRYYGDEQELRNILDSDPVYREIKAYREGKVYWSDTRTSNVFTEFPFHPDLLLNDYHIIFEGGNAEGLRYFSPVATVISR